MMAMNCTTFTRMPVLLEILRSDWPFGRPRLARLYALTATMRPVQFRSSPMAIIHRLATRLSNFSIRTLMEALRNSLHAGALCRQCSSFCPPEWVGGRVHGAHLWDRTQVLAQDLARVRFWQGVEKAYLLRHLVGRKLAPAVCGHVIFSERGARHLSSGARRSRSGRIASLTSCSVKRGVMCCWQFQSNAFKRSREMRSSLAL